MKIEITEIYGGVKTVFEGTAEELLRELLQHFIWLRRFNPDLNHAIARLQMSQSLLVDVKP